MPESVEQLLPRLPNPDFTDVQIVTLPKALNAVKITAEAGVDINGQSSKLADSLAAIEFNLVITVCGHADENCPAFLGKSRVVHVGFDDPPKLAMTAANEEEALSHYRRVRDESREFVADRLMTQLQ